MGSPYRRLEVQLPQFWRADQDAADAKCAKVRNLEAEYEAAEEACHAAQARSLAMSGSLAMVGVPVAIRSLEDILKQFWADRTGTGQAAVSGMTRPQCKDFAEELLAEHRRILRRRELLHKHAGAKNGGAKKLKALALALAEKALAETTSGGANHRRDNAAMASTEIQKQVDAAMAEKDKATRVGRLVDLILDATPATGTAPAGGHKEKQAFDPTDSNGSAASRSTRGPQLPPSLPVEEELWYSVRLRAVRES
jgi:hypothetical protein